MVRPIRVLTVDDHPILREGIAAILDATSDMELAGEAQNGLEAITAYGALRPDVVLMDIQMPQMSGIDATRAICETDPGARIVVLTTYAGDVRAMAAIRAGASGYLLKSMLRRELVSTIRAAHDGRRVIPDEIAVEIARHAGEETLSEREKEILECVAGGFSNKRVAAALNISETTVKAHMRNILAKLGAADRTQAVTLALRRGILDL